MALLPPEIWITSLTTSSGADNLTVAVGAQSLSNFAIADWLTSLHKSSLISNVNLGAISASETAEGALATLTFTMNFTYQRKEN